MKIVVNKCYGGTSIPMVERTSSATIQEVENGLHKSNGFERLVVLELPEETTDWKMVEHDGYETIYYVVNGKINIK